MASALLLTILGVAVMIGWHTRTAVLLQIYPGYIAMSYYTAMGLMASGLSLGLLALGRRQAALAIAVVPLVLGVLSLVQYVFGVDLGIDQTLMAWEGPEPQRYPGRMAPATAVCFSLAGTALVVAAWARRGAWVSWVVAVAASVVGALGLMAMVGYFTGLARVYTWGNFSSMALHTAIAMIVLALGLLAHEWRVSGKKALLDQRWLPMAGGLAVAVSTLLLIQALLGEESRDLRRETKRRQEYLAGRFSRMFESRARALSRFAARWERPEIFSNTAWEYDVRLHLAGERAFETVIRYDANGVPVWATKLGPGDQFIEPTTDADLGAEQRRSLGGKTVVSPLMRMGAGEAGCWLVIALKRAGAPAGWVAASIPMEEMLDRFINEVGRAGFVVVLADDGSHRMEKGDVSAEPYTVASAEGVVPFGDSRLRLRVQPTVAYERSGQSALPWIVAGMGSLLGFAVVLGTQKARHAHAQAGRLAMTNDDLRREVAYRERSDALFRAVAEAAHDAIAVADGQGTIRRWNRAAEQIFGRTEAEVMGKPFNLVLPERFRGGEREGNFGGIPITLGRVTELTGMKKNGEEFPLELSLARWQVGVDIYFGGILRDITARKRVDESMRLSETRLRIFAEHAPAAVAMFDAQMNYLVASQQWYRDYRLEGQVLLGRSHYEVFPEVPQRWRDIHQRCLAGATETAEADFFERADGSKQWISWRVQPWYSTDVTIGGIVMFTEDVSQQVLTRGALRDSEERFRQAFEFAGIGMALVGTDGRWLRVNRAICQLVGYEPDVLLKKTFQEITHPEDLLVDMDYVRQMLAGERIFYQMEKRYFHQDGHIVWVRLTVTLVRDEAGQPVHFIAQIEDITQRRALESQLSTARDHALESSRLKSEFLASMSHEIRTPMNGVLGMTRLLIDSKLGPEQRRMGQVVLSSAENLLTIIDDILDFSKIEAGKMRIDPHGFDVVKLVRETADLLSSQAQAKGIVLAFETAGLKSCGLVGDSGRIRQVLMNLAGNAVKFTARGRVDLRLNVEEEKNGMRAIAIGVKDTGIGISPEVQARLFQPFTQAEAGGRKYGGTGLGLAISRQLIELMGGRIGCESRDGEGSRFWFHLELPTWNPDEETAGQPAKISRSPDGLRLLVAEDNPANQLVARLTLERMGHQVLIANNGREALACLAAERFDAVLMDCQMPEMDGYEATRLVRAGKALGVDPATPIIALTAYALAGDKARCLAAGMNEYVTKPLAADTLRQALARCGLDAGRNRTIPPMSQSVPPVGLPALPVLDEQQLAKLGQLKTPSGEPLTVQLFGMLIKEMPARLEALRTTAEKREVEPLTRVAHTLAGSCANLGATGLGEAARELETAAKAGVWETVAGCLTRIGAEWERLRAELMRRHPESFR